MRLFQAQTLYGDDYSPPPPPHFSPDREATRFMPVYLNQYRDGRQRLPTPEKVAVMELSNSFERRRLGKHQQILNDISKRCREQEVSDMSGKLTMKLNLHKYEKLGKEMTFYSTTFMDPRYRKASVFSDNSKPIQRLPDAEHYDTGSKPIFEKNYRSFPARRVMRHTSKFDFMKPDVSFPTISPRAPRSSVSDSHLLRSKYLKRQNTNVPINTEIFDSPRNNIALLMLPNVDPYASTAAGVQSERLDRMDTYFSTSRVTLGPRAKTQVSMSNVNTDTKQNNVIVAPEKPADMPIFNQEMSQLQLTSGHSPPPNSLRENTFT